MASNVIPRAGNNGWRQIFYEQVGQNVRDKRVAAGLDIATCAQKMGCGAPTLHRTESGDLACSLQLLARFASVVGCHPSDLIPVDSHVLPVRTDDELVLLRKVAAAARAMPSRSRSLQAALDALPVHDDDIDRDEPRQRRCMRCFYSTAGTVMNTCDDCMQEQRRHADPFDS
jgi:transcriptional regulator with XRE-family HTH domain